MGFFKRLFGSESAASKPVASEAQAESGKESSARSQWQDLGYAALVQHHGADHLANLVELKIVGESYRQEALEELAGGRRPESANVCVGTTLRCEPTNEADANAIRVEVQGQHVAYVKATYAIGMSPWLQETHGGVLEAPGLIVGGWDDGETVGHFGIRVWAQVPITETRRRKSRVPNVNAKSS